MKLLRSSGMAIAISLSACASADQYKNFADVGVAYSKSVNATLVAAYDVTLRSNAETLLATNGTEREASFDLETCSTNVMDSSVDGFTRLTCSMLQRGEIFRDLEDHATLLSEYFSTLAQLATSDAPDRAATQAKSQADQLAKVGVLLRQEAPEAIGELARFVVGAVIRGALRQELQARGPTIQQELATEEALLKFLAVDLSADLDRGFNERLLRQVILPYQAGIPAKDADDWIAAYTSLIRTRSTVLPEIAEAGDLAKRLRESFEALARGGDVATQLNQIASDAEQLSRVTEILSH